ncbi:MAG TPA: hypothetical protein VMU51_08955, partial [Mycobacteriales bacterium]|nr:hypothetical protein [Mycobacteriales bacterium]
MVTPLAEARLGPDPAAPYPDLPYEDLAAALRSAVAGGDPAEVGRILDGSGSRILAAGHLLAVEEAVGALPPAALTPARLTLLANARQVRGDAEGALEICRQAAGALPGAGTAGPPGGAVGPAGGPARPPAVPAEPIRAAGATAGRDPGAGRDPETGRDPGAGWDPGVGRDPGGG